MTRAVAIIGGTFYRYNKTGQILERKEHVARTKKTNLPLGDGKAIVGQTRGFSHWYNTREAGMTVKVETSVSITCGQSEEEVTAACEEAGRIAEAAAVESMEEMDMHLDSFAQEAHR